MTGADRSILIVDDQAINIEMLTHALSDDYDVHSAHSGMQALNLLDTSALVPDLILLDIQMPGMDGLEACRRFKNHPKTAGTPIIFISSLDRVQCKTAGFEAGAVDYITKPFNILEVVARIKNHMALKVAQEKLLAANEKYQWLAEHDDLTGLYNTRYLYPALGDEAEKSRETGTPFALLFMDIDHFKEVVDTHGHLNGSTAIAQVAETIKQCLPADAWAVSYGGDEFIAVLPGMDKKQGACKGEEILGAIRDRTFLRAENINIKLTLSCGAAGFPEDAQTSETLLAVADKALFEIKAQGKDAVMEC